MHDILLRAERILRGSKMWLFVPKNLSWQGDSAFPVASPEPFGAKRTY